MQHNLAHLEFARVISEERNSRERTNSRRSLQPPLQTRPARRHAAAILARMAWRLDREAALRVWP
jgi:hypothetical protein